MTQVLRLLPVLLLIAVGGSAVRSGEGFDRGVDLQPIPDNAVSAAPVLAALVRPALVDPDLAPRAIPTGRPLRLAYYFPQDSTSLDSLRANIGHLDVVAPHWLTIDANGTVETIGNISAAATFLRTANAVVLPSVALTSKNAGHQIVTDPDVSSEALSELLEAVETWDGLALDFEGMDASDRPYLTAFINTLGSALHARGKYYAIALPAKTNDAKTGWSGSYDYAGIAQSADLFLVMAYGYKTGSSVVPGSSAPLPWVDAAMAYAVREIPGDRVILGVPFYGYDWNVSNGPPARALRYRDTRELLNRTGATPIIDPDSSSAMFEYTEAGQSHEVWYEDERSLGPKLHLVAKYGLRGVGAWRLGQEDPRSWVVWEQMLAAPRSVTAQIP